MKDFIIIGNMNATTYKDIFPLIKENKVWLGVSSNATMEFILPEHYEKWSRVENGVKYGKVPATSWFTNIEHKKRNTPLNLYKRYSFEDYPKYENYDAIEVSKVSDIPMDYDGVMGVPITFFYKYCPEQFEIVSASDFCTNDIDGWKGVSEEFYKMYYEQGNKGYISVGWPLPHYVDNGKAVIPYRRILIRKRTEKEGEPRMKKFLIIGNFNAVTYKDIFPYIKNNQLWWGVSPRGLNFILPNGEISNVNAVWYTNVSHKKRHTPIDLHKRYSNEYPKYDNYDAIEVSKVSDIPMDYDGVMGVPITFLDKYCPEQFEIIGHEHDLDGKGTSICMISNTYGNQFAFNGRKVYKRLLIRKRTEKENILK